MTIQERYIKVLFDDYYNARKGLEYSYEWACVLDLEDEIKEEEKEVKYRQSIITDFMTNKSNEEELTELAEQYFNN